MKYYMFIYLREIKRDERTEKYPRNFCGIKTQRIYTRKSYRTKMVNAVDAYQ